MLSGRFFFLDWCHCHCHRLQMDLCYGLASSLVLNVEKVWVLPERAYLLSSDS